MFSLSRIAQNRCDSKGTAAVWLFVALLRLVVIPAIVVTVASALVGVSAGGIIPPATVAHPVAAGMAAAVNIFLARCIAGAMETMLMVHRAVHIQAVAVIPVTPGVCTMLMVQGAVCLQAMAVVQSAAGVDTMLMVQGAVRQAMLMVQGASGIKAMLMVQGAICLAMDMVQSAGGEGGFRLCLHRHGSYRKKPGRCHQKKSANKLPKEFHLKGLPYLISTFYYIPFCSGL